VKWIKYSKYTDEDLGIDANDLLQALSDYLLQSGFNDPYNPTGEWQEQSLDDLKEAIRRALEEGSLFPDDKMEEMMQKLASMSDQQMEKLVDSLI
jgi:Ca-activated chloride channel family protein